MEGLYMDVECGPADMVLSAVNSGTCRFKVGKKVGIIPSNQRIIRLEGRDKRTHCDVDIQ